MLLPLKKKEKLIFAKITQVLIKTNFTFNLYLDCKMPEEVEIVENVEAEGNC